MFCGELCSKLLHFQYFGTHLPWISIQTVLTSFQETSTWITCALAIAMSDFPAVLMRKPNPRKQEEFCVCRIGLHFILHRGILHTVLSIFCTWWWAWLFVALCGASEEEHASVCSIRRESNTCALPKDKTERPVHSDTKDFVRSRAPQVLRRYVKLETGCTSTMTNQFRFASSLWTR